jgi:D-2-hydroxyacid dehydrogenase (NADP+)
MAACERPPIRSVLLIGNAPGADPALLQPRFPDVCFAALRPGEDTEATLRRVGPDAVYSINGAEFPPATHLAAASHPSVRWVHVGGSGFEHVMPLPPGRVLSHSPGLLVGPHAEAVMGIIVALNANVLTYVEQQRRRVWAPHPFRPLHGRTLLVVGLGRVGSALAALARAIGMRVIGVKRQPTPHPHADEVVAYDRLHEALGDADIVSVHLRVAPETRDVFDARAFAVMRQGAIFVNTARGALVEEDALVAALRDGRIAAAHLDVFRTEPLPPSSPFWDVPNLLVTPHVADNTGVWPQLFADAFAENLRRWRSGEALLNEVPPPDQADREDVS